MAGVTIEGVTKVYGSRESGIVAVSDLDIEISDGEFVVLVGPSGCGKSTTLRMVAGLETITEGTISIDGEIVNDSEPRDRDVAMVFQNYALYPHMTIRENIGFGLRYSSDLSKDDRIERVEDAAAMMGIEELLDDKPGQLSGGQRQRVALGRAIVREPQAFLFDEPLSNLDAKLRVKMRTEILQLQRELGVTSIYVTHDQAEAMTMGDRVAVLDGGELQQLAPPQEVYDHPVNRFVAGFIGSPSMDFMETTVEERNDRYVLVGRSNDTLSYALDRSVTERLELEGGTDLTLGVRPEDLDVIGDPADRDPRNSFEATVDVVEPMGSDNFLTLDVGESDSWTARVDSSFVPEEGSQVGVTFDESVLHLFAADGETLKSQGTTTESYHEAEPMTP
ncbi:sugar ABC transporter ATP-binding protein [Halobacteriales archaeon QH_6_64_20]|nr:MAG: sugar ABC transporter ATP-binding protein [Halobacteriales archaeon QH_6_64_20]